MRITSALLDEITEHALEQAPLECCGLIACDHDGLAVKVMRARNAAVSEWRYELDGVQQMAMFAQIADAELCLGAIYHSHTHAPPVPSEVDVQNAFYPDVLYLIVGLEDIDWPEVHAFSIIDGLVTPELLDICRG